MTVFLNSNPWRVLVADVVAGARSVSHNALALLGLAAVTGVVFLAGRADLQSRLESKVMGWLMDRASARTAAASPDIVANDILLAMAEPEAITRATAADPAGLNRQQAALVNWISRRYSVAQEPITRLVQEAWAVGKTAGMDPTLILAVMAVESSFNPFAQSHVGAQGLMQVMTGIHHDKYELFGGRRAAFDPVTNLRVGVQVLQDCIRRAGSLEVGLKHYVGAANLPADGGYALKVLAEQAYLRDVAAGRRVATTAPLPQPGAVVAEASVAVPPASAQAATLPDAASEAGPPASLVAPAAPAASEAPLTTPRPPGQQVALAPV